MSKYVIGPDVAWRLAEEATVIGAGHQLLAPTLLRSQLVSLAFGAVHRDELSRKEAEERIDYVRKLRIRLLGDRALLRLAYEIADYLEWSETYDAEYLALTRLHADAFVTLDPRLADAAKGLVPVASIDALS
jgi:predicted nucleic acid-binding protein